MTRVKMAHPPTDRESLYWTVRAMFGISIPRTRVCPDHCSPFQAFADAYFGQCTIRNGVEQDPEPITQAIWIGSRGLAGKSYTLSVLGLSFGYFLGADISVLGGSMSQSANVHEYMSKGMTNDRLPPEMLLDQTATRIVLSNRGRMRPLPASQKNVRGPHPSILLCLAGWTEVQTPDGPRRIDGLTAGQTVGVSHDMTSSGWDIVRRVVDQGYKQTLTIRLSNGAELTCTPDHRIATGRGWVEARHLRPNDVLTMWRKPGGPEEKQDRLVRDVLRSGPAVRTWDITTSTGNFFADGVLVHNCDEVDEMELDIYDAALGQPMPRPNWLGNMIPAFTVVSSTHQHPDGTLTEILRRNDENGGRIPVYRFCYRENSTENNPPGEGWLTERTIQEKRDSVSAEMFRVEYDLGEPSIGNRAFDTEAVDAAFCLPFNPVTEETRKDFEEYTFATPVRGAFYVATADWAKEQDKTAIGVIRIDDDRRELVYFARMNRLPYPTMIDYYNKAVQRYRVSINGAWHDSTGLGNVVNDYLDTRAKPFKMVGDKRTKMLSDFVNAIEKSAAKKGPWRLPKIPSAYTEMKFCRVEDLYSTANAFHLPDTVCMFALAEYAARKVVPSVAPIAVGDRSEPSKLQRSMTHQEEGPRKEVLSPEEPEPDAMRFYV